MKNGWCRFLTYKVNELYILEQKIFEESFFKTQINVKSESTTLPLS
jgi:hypothetical protein